MPKPDAIKPLAHSKHIFMGLYGYPSCGKTNLIATLPNTLIIRPPIEHTDGVLAAAAGVEEWVVDNWNEMSLDGGVLEYLQHEGHKHAFVWLDSVSGWQDIGLDDVWKDTVARFPHRKKTPIDRGEYNANMVRLAQFVRSCVGADSFNFGFTAWPENLEDPMGNSTLMPWVQGKNMSNRLCGYMKIVAYLERKETGKDDAKKMVRVLRTAESEDYFARDAYNSLPNGRMVNPTMPKLMEAIEAARAARKPAVKKSPARKPVRRVRRTTS